jgi:hypothetical protein
LVEETHHRPRQSALARLRGRFGGRRSDDGLRMRRGRDSQNGRRNDCLEIHDFPLMN